MLLKFVYTDVRMIQLRSIVSLIYEDYSSFPQIPSSSYTKVHAHVTVIPVLRRTG